MKLLIAVHHRFELWTAPPWLEERLRQDFPQLEVVMLPDYDRVSAEITDAEIFLGWSLRPEQFIAAKKLRWIHSTAAAVHQLMSPELVASKVILTNAREVHGPVVAEHAIAVIFALAKRLPSAVRCQEKLHWAQQEIWREHPQEIAGSTVGIVGLGSIGREVARQAKALGMKVLAARAHPERPAENVDQVFSVDKVEALLEQSDFVVLAAPLTAQSEKIINASRLARMKRTAFLINVSRGPLIEDTALIAALESQTIAGAALDVFAQEPLPSDSPYWKLKNCLITPHTAAVTDKLWERHYALFTANLRRFIAGEPLAGIVDKKQGY